ncbi:hypothetical protein GCM10011409_05970 [Lentibacillus populi]|uniref:Uncharacterized protein n=1 Tax=Lentibacillus populi TaxID=1827502 RepID=A0A9W5X4E4_9BACI|nr:MULTISPECIES: hypothetical protein [Bacillaceae]GGB31391.1 hypothetical protein GCM10011409_05970 [Lentibacillus populi]
MKYLDWHMIFFTGVTLVHDYWIFWGLPQIHYWEMKQTYPVIGNDDKDDGNKAA